MKRYFIFLLTTLLPLCANAQKTGRYTIKGLLPDSAHGSYVQLSGTKTLWEDNLTLDSALVKNGKFQFKGKSSGQPFLGHLHLSNNSMYRRANVIVEPGEICVDMRDSVGCSAQGTPLNDSYYTKITALQNAYGKIMGPLMKVREAKLEDGTWTDTDEVSYRDAVPMDQQAVMQKQQIEFIEDNLQYPYVVLEGVDIYYWLYSDYQDQNKIQLPEWLNDILAKLPKETVDRIKRSQEVGKQKMKEYYKSNPPDTKKPKETAPPDAEAGQPLIDFSDTTADGKVVRLSELTRSHKLVLLDFWASWCGPCMKEMPLIAELYAEYKDKGLEILGISSDDSGGPWKRAIESRQMTWPQIRGSEEISVRYGIKFIPYAILVDYDGTIVARGLRGEKLRQKVAELMDESETE